MARGGGYGEGGGGARAARAAGVAAAVMAAAAAAAKATAAAEAVAARKLASEDMSTPRAAPLLPVLHADGSTRLPNERQSAVSTCTRGRGSRAGRGTCAGARFEYTCPPLTRRLIGGFALERSCTSSPHTWETLHGRLTSNTAERGWRAPHGTHAGRRRARRRGRHPPWTTGDGLAAGSGKRRRQSAQLGVKVPAAASGCGPRSRPGRPQPARGRPTTLPQTRRPGQQHPSRRAPADRRDAMSRARTPHPGPRPDCSRRRRRRPPSLVVDDCGDAAAGATSLRS